MDVFGLHIQPYHAVWIVAGLFAFVGYLRSSLAWWVVAGVIFVFGMAMSGVEAPPVTGPEAPY